MKMEKFVNNQILFTGSGTFLGIVLSLFLSNPMKSLVGTEWSKEATSGTLVVLGSLMMTMKASEIKQAGLGLGSAGFATLGSALFQRFTGNKAFALNGETGTEGSSDNGNGGNGEIPDDKISPMSGNGVQTI